MEKYISLIIGFLGMFMTGVLYSFNTYAVALKSTFNYTQSDIETIAASGDLGQSILLFPVGLIFDKFGPRVACTFALICTGGGFTSLWVITQWKATFSPDAWLVSIIYGVIIFGTAFSYLSSVAVNSKNFGGKHKLKIIMSHSCVYWNAPTVYSAIYQGLFVQGHIKDTENQKIGDFMLFLAVLAIVINLLAIAKLKILRINGSVQTHENELNELFESLKSKQDMVADDKMEKNEIYLNDRTALISNADFKVTTAHVPDLKGYQTIKTLPFYYLFLALFIFAGSGGTFVNNISTVLKSAGREHDIAVFTICIPIFSTVGIISIGLLSNYIYVKRPNIPTSASLVPCALLICISLFVMVSLYDSFLGLFISAIMMSLGFGSFYVQIQWVITELFGVKYIGQNIGIILTGHGLGVFGLQQLFGWSYKLNSLPGSKYCDGEYCSKWTFILLSLLCSCALVLTICNVKIEKDNIWRQNEKQ